MTTRERDRFEIRAKHCFVKQLPGGPFAFFGYVSAVRKQRTAASVELFPVSCDGQMKRDDPSVEPANVLIIH